MDQYARAAARVHAGLLALQAVPDAIRANYSDEFTREVVRAAAAGVSWAPSLTGALLAVQCTNYPQETRPATHAIYL